MTPLAAFELIGFLACCVGLWFINQARVRLTSDGRLTLILIFSVAGIVHFLDALEWSGFEAADRFGDIIKIFTPAAWLFFLFVVRRDGLLHEVARQDQQLDFFFKHAPMAIAVLDAEDRYVAASQKWLELHALTNHPQGLPLGGESDPCSHKWLPHVARARQKNGVLSGVEEEPTETGSRWFEWKAERILAPQHQRGLILLVDVVTARIQEEQTRQKLQSNLVHQQNLQTIGEIAAGVAHDVNNLLQVIGAHTSALEDGDFNQADFKDSLNSIRDAVVSASGMTRLLLRHGNLDPPRYDHLDLGQLLRRVTHLLEKVMGRTQKLIIQYPAQPLIIQGNETLIEQLLINLVINARDALPARGTIEVIAEQRDDTVSLHVKDNGEGIEESIRSRILEPFFTTKGQQGTGMGLAVVQRVVLAHEAELELQTEPGEGSVFSVHFPRPGHLADGQDRGNERLSGLVRVAKSNTFR
jgi:signal transduction histidine kinase